MRKLLGISYLEHKINDWVRSKINFLVCPQEPLLATVSETCMARTCHTPRHPLQNLPSGHLVKRWKLAWLGHVTRHDILSKTFLQDTLSRDGNLHGSDMSHAMTASPKPSFRTPWRVGDAVVSRGNAGWTTSKYTSLPMPELPTMASCRKDWKRISAESSLMFPRRLYRPRK